MDCRVKDASRVEGEFVDFRGERFYAIRNVDAMAPFFISVISNDDHWLFVSSNGALTAGRVSPETALFPYLPVDRIHENALHTGSRTLVRAMTAEGERVWEPFNREQDGRFSVERNLYKSVLGNQLCFEEINHDLDLAFRYTWMMSAAFGFVRQCELENLGDEATGVEVIDGLQNILPAGTPRFTQTNSSNLVDAYKWTELDEATGLAMLTLYSAITDRAEPCESLRATTVFALGIEAPRILISSNQLNAFRHGEQVDQETLKRGVRGAYLLNFEARLKARGKRAWKLVLNAEQSQADVVNLRRRLRDGAALADAVDVSIAAGSDELARIIGASDGFQAAAEENVTVHHYANVLFNVLRGGIFANQYMISSADFSTTIRHFNRALFEREQQFLAALPAELTIDALLTKIAALGDGQLRRLAHEYLPITFGRRHGDPSRPWNQFAIKLKDEQGRPLLSYQGNWRDIFQNWEALSFSYPGFIESVIAKFVNASTMDGYNPYRITKEGIDWEVEEHDNPWSYIGYWGDHQIIYLLKLLELSSRFHPQRLRELLRDPIFSYANVPYRLRPFDAVVRNAKSTVDFDDELAQRIDGLVTSMGADGKLLLDTAGEVYQVNLLEKLLVPLLAKLGNLVVGGGIWLNTQRPEWNDANNALVGHGLSMVTLCYLRRYLAFLEDLLGEETGVFEVSTEIADWLEDTCQALGTAASLIDDGDISDQQRYAILAELGQAASRYRQRIYRHGRFSGKTSQAIGAVRSLLAIALRVVDYSIGINRRQDGLYHAYNLLNLGPDSASVDALYPMLEGQVAVLSSGAIEAKEVVQVVEALFASEVYRADQQSFMLYPDRKLPGFLEKNRTDAAHVNAIGLLREMLAAGDHRLVVVDADGACRFSPGLSNAGALDAALDRLETAYPENLRSDRDAVHALYESVFNHKAFTGRSGTMFGFEGLGSIYWHMVSKLLLAVQENFFATLDHGDGRSTEALAALYYRVREGIGFNKTPEAYGAFPTDPYSHTPKHAGARQPGMTGQVKEEVLSRFGELGIRVDQGRVRFQPALLRKREFTRHASPFRFLDVDNNWQALDVPDGALAFTWCQVPIVYQLEDVAQPSITILRNDGSVDVVAGLALSAAVSTAMFARSGEIRQLTLHIPASQLLGGGL